MKTNLAAFMKEYEEYLFSGDKDIEYMYFPCELLALNQAIGDSRGIRSGSIIQLLGKEGRGKTTLALNYVAQAQKKPIKEIMLPSGQTINAVIADFERSFDKEYAKSLGVDTSKLLVVKTPFAEDTFDIIEELLSMGIQIFVIDSIPMIIPRSEDGKSFTDAERMAASAGPITRFIKRATQLVDSAHALMILINQYRANISPMAHTDKKAYGPWIIGHQSKVILTLDRKSRSDEQMTIVAFVEKTKLGATGKKLEYDIIQGQGVDVAGHILGLAITYEIVDKSGAWYYYPSKNDPQYKAQGLDNARDILPIEEIKQKVVAEMLKEDRKDAD